MERYGKNAYALMEKLNYVRVAGTDGENRAADTIDEALRAMGISSSRESFEIDAYEIKTARLTVTAPFEAEYAITGYGLSGSTGPDGIRAPFLYAEDGDEITLAKAKGKIVLLNGHVSPDQYAKIVKAGAVGFITISGTLLDEYDKTDLELRTLRAERHLKNGEIGKIPGVSIRAKDALAMLKREPEEVAITLIQEEKKAISQNIIAEIEGGDLKDEWITFGAHYDTVPFSPGMYDNASGSAIILEVIRHFATHRPRRSLRFIWFGAEEKGLLGSLYHVRQNPEEIKQTRLMINVDLAGLVIGAHHARVSAEESVCSVVRFLAQEIGFGMTVTQDIYSSDSEPYADAGVPAISFYRGGPTGGHSRNDVIEPVSAKSLEASTRFCIHFSERLINSEVFPVPWAVPEKIKEKLEVYFGRKSTEMK